jgi:DNA-binding Lrp family transcriptional regulator
LLLSWRSVCPCFAPVESEVSQPTVSRMLARLEKKGVIREYTVMPDFQKLGYSVVAIMFGRLGTVSRARIAKLD